MYQAIIFSLLVNMNFHGAHMQANGVKLNAQLADFTALVRLPLEQNARRKVTSPLMPSCLC